MHKKSERTGAALIAAGTMMIVSSAAIDATVVGIPVGLILALAGISLAVIGALLGGG